MSIEVVQTGERWRDIHLDSDYWTVVAVHPTYIGLRGPGPRGISYLTIQVDAFFKTWRKVKQ